MFAYLIKLLKALNSNTKPSQIAHSFCIGLILGFLPKNNLLWYILALFFAFIRINKTGYLIMIFVGSCFAYLLDPFFDSLGYTVLSFEPLSQMYSYILNIPLLGFTKINNTVVMGALTWGILSYIPLFFLLLGFIHLWRTKIAHSFNNSKFLQTIYKIPLVRKLADKIEEVQ